jgi:hypothetical protein
MPVFRTLVDCSEQWRGGYDRAVLDIGVIKPAGAFASPDDAWRAAREVVDAAAGREDPLTVIGDFVIPPPDGPPTRDFQTLHFDFGVPLAPAAPADVARFTALHVAADAPPTDAVTRFVPLHALPVDARWPERDELVRRFAAYGRSHGAWDDAAGYLEGSFARIVEAAVGEPPALPSVKTEAGFRCGMEFATLVEERAFFAQRGVPLDGAEIEVQLAPGEMLVFDNLAVAHGRRGVRAPGELRQRVFGHQALGVERQVELRDRVLGAFATLRDRHGARRP